MKKIVLAALALGVWAAQAQAATIVFSDNFEDGNVSDWSFNSFGYSGTAAHGATAASHSGAYAMETYLIAPPGGVDLIARTSHSFSAPVAGNYKLSLWAKSAPCSGCTMSYDILIDGTSLTRTFATSFQEATFNLANLTAGQHVLTLGIHTTNASSGKFVASFDDVTISTEARLPASVPEPGALGLLALGIAAIAAGRSRKAA